MVYSDNDIRNIALQYKTRKEFEQGNRSAYTASVRRGPFIDKNGNIVKYKSGITNTLEFHNEICKHMIPQGNLYKRVIYVYKFFNENNDKSHAYVGLTCNPIKRNQQHTQKITHKTVVKKFIEKNSALRYEYEVLTDFVNPDIAIRLEDEYINKFKNEGWVMLNVSKGGALGGNTGTPLKELEKTISKYTYMADFMKNEKNSYMVLLNRGLVDVLTKDLIRKKHTDDDLIKTAVECGSLSEFLKRYKNTKYPSAYRKGLIPKIRELLEN